jgi:flagellin-specific chaperone FliS
MKGWIVVFGVVAGVVGGASPAKAQDIVSIIQQAVTKVIRAVDLEVQRIQTQTIVLQEAQKEVENAMSALRLGEIQDWVEQFKDLYSEYFQELWQVKSVIGDYHKVQEIIARQQEILNGYQQGLGRFRQDPHFSPAELGQIVSVYGGILTASEKNLEALTTVIQGFALQMTDQQRLARIDEAGAGMDRTWRDMQVFTNQNELISLQRAQDESDYQSLRKLYGL